MPGRIIGIGITGVIRERKRKGLGLMGEFEEGGPGYALLLDMSRQLGRMEAKLDAHISEPCASCVLQERVRVLESERAGDAGERRVKKTVFTMCFELGKLAAAALFGGFVSKKM